MNTVSANLKNLIEKQTKKLKNQDFLLNILIQIIKVKGENKMEELKRELETYYIYEEALTTLKEELRKEESNIAEAIFSQETEKNSSSFY